MELNHPIQQDLREDFVTTTNLDKFIKLYEAYLKIEVLKKPEEYRWYPQTSVETVIGRMRDAIVKNSFNKESNAIRKTCKDLGIGWNYKSIQAFISQSQNEIGSKEIG